MTTALRTAEPVKAFLALQALDVLSTFLGFSVGLGEANPFLRNFFPVLGPVAGLLFGKVLAATVIYFYVTKLSADKQKNLWKFTNIAFMLLVTYNLTCVAIRLAAMV